MAIIQTGSNTAGAANVDAGFNLNVTLPNTKAYMGGVRLFSENDDGTATGTAYLKSPETSPDYRLRVGTDTVLFDDNFNAVTQNTGMWKHAFTTMTMTQSAGFLNVNAAGTSTVASNYASLQTWKHFPMIGTAPLSVEFILNATQIPIANEVFLCGLGLAVAAAPPIDGVWFEYTSAGLYGVLRYNSGAATSLLLSDTAALGINTNHKLVMVVGEREVEFWMDDILRGEISIPSANGQPFITSALPVFIEKYNSALVGSSPNMIVKVGNVTVTMLDLQTNKPWGHQMAGAGLMSSQGQDGHTSYISTAVAATAVPAAAAALVAASATAQFTGLGGIFRVLPTLASGTEGLLCSYLNPVGSVNITPRTLYITGVKIYSTVEVALTGGPLINVYQLCYGASAQTLVTAADSASFATATAKCYRRIPIGMEVYGAAAAIGNTPNPSGLSLDLSTAPIAVNPGEYVSVGCRNQGTVTTLGNLLITVAFTGYWE